MIDIDDYSVNIVGMRTLELIEDELKKYKEEGQDGVVVNFRDKGINKEYNEFLAELKYEYRCKYKGIGNKKHQIEVYLMTGFFLKKSLGHIEYTKWFKRQVERADFPLMIRDNRLSKYSIVPLNVIQPLKFERKYFHYNVVKPQYLEPEDLERAIKDQEDIYTKETIRIEDIGNEVEGFRFAGTRDERYMLDIFEDILTGRVEGYQEDRVG